MTRSSGLAARPFAVSDVPISPARAAASVRRPRGGTSSRRPGTGVFPNRPPTHVPAGGWVPAGGGLPGGSHLSALGERLLRVIRGLRGGAGLPAATRSAVAGQFALLVVLSVVAGLDVFGWLAGLGVVLGTCRLLGRGLRRTPASRRGSRLGPADLVTLARAVLVGGVAALAVDSLTRAVPVAVMVPVTVLALLLDAVDGSVARRTGTSSALGARFDMELDAFLILLLSVHQARPLGGWVIAVGAMRYAFVAAGSVWPWLRGELPGRYSRKVVAAVQGVVLMVATAGVLPLPVTRAVVAGALALLCWSFGRDVAWLARTADDRRPGAPAARVRRTVRSWGAGDRDRREVRRRLAA
ncbi:MAG TPA: CDP-alcohol phosphatidyltransferase family protein [Kineosporiaceae bacterium]